MVNYDTIIERAYWDPNISKLVKVNLKVIDALYLDYLKKIADALDRQVK